MVGVGRSRRGLEAAPCGPSHEVMWFLSHSGDLEVITVVLTPLGQQEESEAGGLEVHTGSKPLHWSSSDRFRLVLTTADRFEQLIVVTDSV